jgi:hypothetical protein
MRWSPEISETVHAAESYARLRNQWIEINPEIKGGEPTRPGGTPRKLWIDEDLSPSLVDVAHRPG